MTTNNFASALALFLGLLALFPAQASEHAQALYERIELMERVINHSPQAEQIRNGSETEPAHQLNQASMRLDSAQRALENHRLEQTEKQLDYATAAFVSAVAEMADANDQGDAQKNRFNELSVGVESFRLYVNNAILKSGGENPLDQIRLDSLTNLAAMIANQGNYGAANQLLDEAYMLTITAVSALKGGDTIVYSLDFQTPEDEYRYERDRYQGLIKLFRMLHPDMKLPAQLRWTEQHLRASTDAYNNAEKLAGSQAYPQAIEQLENASKDLTRILRLMGLPIS